MGLLGDLLKGSGTVRGVVTFRSRPPGFEWVVVIGFMEAEPGSQPVRGLGNPFDQMNPKHTAGFMTMRTDGFELDLPAGHYHVVVHLRAAEFTAPDRMAVDPRVQIQWPLPGTIEVVKGQVKALNLKVDAYHPDQPAPASAHILSSPLDGPPSSHAEPPPPQPSAPSEPTWLLTWLPEGQMFARPDGEAMPRPEQPPEAVVAALGKAERTESTGSPQEALAAWTEAESAIESLRMAGHLLPLRASLGRARALLALRRTAEALDTLQVQISPGRCLRWLPTAMAVQLVTLLGEASTEAAQVERCCSLALMISSHLPQSAPEVERLGHLRESLTRMLAAHSADKALEVLERQGLAVESSAQQPDLYGLQCRIVLLRKMGRDPAALWLLTQTLQQLDAGHPRRAIFEKLRAQFPSAPASPRPEAELLSSAAVKRIQEGELGNRLMELVLTGNLPELTRLHAAGVSMDAPQPGMRTALMGAAHQGNAEIVRFLLSAGANVNARDEDARTALLHAADEGHAGVIRLLLQRGASVRAVDKGLQTPLHLACWQNHVDAMRELLRAGAPVDARDCTQRTPLMLAATEDVPESVMLLCQAGADVEAHDFGGNTPLMMAAMEGRSRVAQVLLSRGARASTTNRNGLTALQWAQSYEHEETARLLRVAG